MLNFPFGNKHDRKKLTIIDEATSKVDNSRLKEKSTIIEKPLKDILVDISN